MTRPAGSWTFAGVFAVIGVVALCVLCVLLGVRQPDPPGDDGDTEPPFPGGPGAAFAARADRRAPAELYPEIPLAKAAAWARPRATVRGTVAYVKHEEDGDWHFRLEDGDARLVCEIIPELALTPPKVGDRLAVSGVVRFDREHRWAEIHPVIRIDKVKL